MTEHGNSEYDKYLIFLPNRYFKTKKTCFLWKKYAHHVVEELTDKGISAHPRSAIKNYMAECFDEDTIPKINTLYIHLMNGEYYSDELYSKKKMEREREILFLLAAKLGVSRIDFETEVTETVVSMMETSFKIKNVDNGTSFNKKISKTKGQTGREVYLNRGAPVYCLSKNIRQVEDNIREKFRRLDSRVFSYDFYRNSNKLTCFVYKRFNFKMLSLQYTCESEDVIDKSFEVKTTLLDYGIGMKFKENSVFTEKVTYDLTFFDDKELIYKLMETIRLKNDPFAIIREVYESQDDKNIAVFRIVEYARKYSQSCMFKYKDEKDEEKYQDMEERLDKLIKDNEPGTFEGVCHNFISTYQIRNWFYTNLLEIGEERLESKDDTDISVMELQQRQYDRYKNRVMKYDDDSDSDEEIYDQYDPKPLSIHISDDDSNRYDWMTRDKPPTTKSTECIEPDGANPEDDGDEDNEDEWADNY